MMRWMSVNTAWRLPAAARRVARTDGRQVGIPIPERNQD